MASMGMMNLSDAGPEPHVKYNNFVEEGGSSSSSSGKTPSNKMKKLV